MNEEILKKCPLFSGLNEKQAEEIIEYISPKIMLYSRDEFIFSAGGTLNNIGIVLSGEVQVLKEDALGGNIILAGIQPGDMFGESFALSGEPLTVSIRVSSDNTEIMFIPTDTVMAAKSLPYGDSISANLISLFAKKNLFLTGRIDHLTRRTLKDKVMAYLMDCSLKSGSTTFTIPFDRQAMADYLAADRSALSYVLSRLKQEGRISYHKNSFTIYSCE